MKRGDVREDGRMFWGMNKGREEWRTPGFCQGHAEKH